MALTPEQQKQIRLARVIYKNMWENQLGPALQEFAEMQRERQNLFAPWRPQPRHKPNRQKTQPSSSACASCWTP